MKKVIVACLIALIAVVCVCIEGVELDAHKITDTQAGVGVFGIFIVVLAIGAIATRDTANHGPDKAKAPFAR